LVVKDFVTFPSETAGFISDLLQIISSVSKQITFLQISIYTNSTFFKLFFVVFLVSTCFMWNLVNLFCL